MQGPVIMTIMMLHNQSDLCAPVTLLLPVLATPFPHDTQDSPHIAAEILAGHRSGPANSRPDRSRRASLARLPAGRTQAAGRVRDPPSPSRSHRIGQHTPLPQINRNWCGPPSGPLARFELDRHLHAVKVTASPLPNAVVASAPSPTVRGCDTSETNAVVPTPPDAAEPASAIREPRPTPVRAPTPFGRVSTRSRAPLSPASRWYRLSPR
jgi:hypothetical protein